MCSVSLHQVITVPFSERLKSRQINFYVCSDCQICLAKHRDLTHEFPAMKSFCIHARIKTTSILLIILSRSLFALEKLQTKLLKLLHRHTRTSRAFVDKSDCVRQASTTIRSRTRDKTRLIENWSRHVSQLMKTRSHEVTQKAAGNRIVYPYWFTHT